MKINAQNSDKKPLFTSITFIFYQGFLLVRKWKIASEMVEVNNNHHFLVFVIELGIKNQGLAIKLHHLY